MSGRTCSMCDEPTDNPADDCGLAFCDPCIEFAWEGSES